VNSFQTQQQNQLGFVNEGPKQLSDLTDEQLKMIEVSRKNAQEKKRKREQELQAESTQKTSQKAVRFSEATAEDGARASKRI
jgi:succinate dehydrogenase/fumarate reductase flavoprotein subunit